MLSESSGGMRMPWGWESVKDADTDAIPRAREVTMNSNAGRNINVLIILQFL